MENDDRNNPTELSDPDATLASPEQPLLIVPATQPPEFPGGLGSPAGETHMPTEIIPITPIVPIAAPGVVHEPYAPTYVAPLIPDEDDRRPAWPYVAAVIALLIGGLAGYLIGAAGDDNENVAPSATVADEPATEPSASDNAGATEDLQAQVDLLAAARAEATDLADQVTSLETALADVTAERDALLLDAGSQDDTASETQAALDVANGTIVELTDELSGANTDLEAANATIVERDDAVRALQGQLDTANKALTDLNVKKVPSYVNGDVAKARTDAAANGWTLIEVPTASASTPVGVVVDQAPPANSNMVKGSVLYVEVATRS